MRHIGRGLPGQSVGFEETSSFSEGGVPGCSAACNAGGSVRDQVRAIKNMRAETLLVVAENSPLQTGQVRVDPQEQAP